MKTCMKKKADMGMGTLIIFIALILVAAVAASVLIATTSKLQNKALDTGKLTTTEVGTGLQAIEVYAENGANQSLEYWYETIKLAAGSDPLRFSDVVMTMSLSNASTDYLYASEINCSTDTHKWTGENVGFLNHTHVNFTLRGYGIEYQINGSTHTDGYLNKGDVVKLCWASSRYVMESEEVEITIIPKVGSNLVVTTTTPDLMVDKRITIFP